MDGEGYAALRTRARSLRQGRPHIINVPRGSAGHARAKTENMWSYAAVCRDRRVCDRYGWRSTRNALRNAFVGWITQLDRSSNREQ
jgi:hypothetical protein